MHVPRLRSSVRFQVAIERASEVDLPAPDVLAGVSAGECPAGLVLQSTSSRRSKVVLILIPQRELLCSIVEVVRICGAAGGLSVLTSKRDASDPESFQHYFVPVSARHFCTHAAPHPARPIIRTSQRHDLFHRTNIYNNPAEMFC